MWVGGEISGNFPICAGNIAFLLKLERPQPMWINAHALPFAVDYPRAVFVDIG